MEHWQKEAIENTDLLSLEQAKAYRFEKEVKES